MDIKYKNNPFLAIKESDLSGDELLRALKEALDSHADKIRRYSCLSSIDDILLSYPSSCIKIHDIIIDIWTAIANQENDSFIVVLIFNRIMVREDLSMEDALEKMPLCKKHIRRLIKVYPDEDIPGFYDLWVDIFKDVSESNLLDSYYSTTFLFEWMEALPESYHVKMIEICIEIVEYGESPKEIALSELKELLSDTKC